MTKSNNKEKLINKKKLVRDEDEDSIISIGSHNSNSDQIDDDDSNDNFDDDTDSNNSNESNSDEEYDSMNIAVLKLPVNFINLLDKCISNDKDLETLDFTQLKRKNIKMEKSKKNKCKDPQELIDYDYYIVCLEVGEQIYDMMESIDLDPDDFFIEIEKVPEDVMEIVNKKLDGYFDTNLDNKYKRGDEIGLRLPVKIHKAIETLISTEEDFLNNSNINSIKILFNNKKNFEIWVYPKILADQIIKIIEKCDQDPKDFIIDTKDIYETMEGNDSGDE